LFANHFFVKSDVYFHSGYYPTIFDSKEEFDKSHEEEHTPDNEEDHNFLGKPKDWIDRFSRNFFPARHTHLGDSGCGHSCCQRKKNDHGHDDHDHDHAHDHDHDHAHDHGGDHHHHDHATSAPLEREILPWLRLSAEMDPQRVETYVIASFWLRGKLGKVDEAEQFLREGLRANPGDGEILYELGRIYHEDRKDYTRARNVLELALINSREKESRKPRPNLLLLGGILNQLALLEREQNNYPRAIDYYTQLKEISASKTAVQEWIDYLKTNGPPIAAPGPVVR
jgi:tetratricopeptide (TPR) repeat protein